MRPAIQALLLTAASACTSHDGPPMMDDPCADGHCDLPKDPAEQSCTNRRNDAFNPNRTSFNPTFLRWSCHDVPGVTEGDRGQEYCEYFAVAKLPDPVGTTPPSAPVILGRNLGKKASAGTTPTSVDLTAAQIDALEAAPTTVVGQCVFTSWNSDIAQTTCTGTSCPAKPKVMGLDVDTGFRMKFDVNSAAAGKKLVDDCHTLPPEGDPDNARDVRNDTFMRGCMFDHDINKTEFRKSDTTVCAAAAHMSECGCNVTPAAPGKTLGDLVSPATRRGFQLGTWTGFVPGDQKASKLPANCRYVDFGDNSQSIVTCDLTADDLLYGAADMKAYCADKYADNIVVHVGLPLDKVACDPATSASPYAATCTATPWILTPDPKSGE